MSDEHDNALNGLAKRVSEMLADSADIVSNAIKAGAKYLPTKEIEQYEAAVTSAEEAVKILHKVGGSSLTGVAANDPIYSQPVFDSDFAQNWNHRPGFESIIKNHSTNS